MSTPLNFQTWCASGAPYDAGLNNDLVDAIMDAVGEHPIFCDLRHWPQLKRAISLHMDGPKQGATLWAHYLVVAQGLWEKYQAACKRLGTAAEHGYTLDAKWNYVTDMFGHLAVRERG